ncbi:hypothetical protein SLS62_010108 [Diatrype stigma]|uniref:Uncharacterized protein n=1 Tax=Diatrype stigma TaxID=117547 RepID=A0AAN9UIA8_9PEZI
MLTNRRSNMMMGPHRRTPSYAHAAGPGSSAATTISNLPPAYSSSGADPLGNAEAAAAAGEPHCNAPTILTSTTAELPGYRVARALGAAYGIATCTRARDLKSLLKSLRFGDEPRTLTHALYGARERAVERLTLDCVRMGANAIVGVTYAETEILGVAQVSVSGTAVYVERENNNSNNNNSNSNPVSVPVPVPNPGGNGHAHAGLGLGLGMGVGGRHGHPSGPPPAFDLVANK